MPRKFIQRLLPDHKKVKETRSLRMFGALLHDPNLWHLNRRSAKGAFGLGLFFAFWPVPFQMVLSAAVAIPLRVNLPLSIVTCWISNPFTMPPLFYGAYLVGSTVLGTEMSPFSFELSWAWLIDSIGTKGPAFLLGCLICSVVAGLIGYFGLDWVWRWSVSKAWRKRRGAIEFKDQ
ncbi:DUF2062 domain-containing protein [Glaciecola sp. XM2]|jgi:uncharacterized protein (DUF2062 family)|uniref:DUF2062 domain-containing protein n=1 Tax=Glaciecola sp. XM2 TaxID=1914931 RepID=UPI001BDE1B3A|nr:DUF2062 domain-containing protein [Glaciecola sp. XM2]MBT1452010.1 DUF2062 domain-containing protein [Glaciecola sp. XM2]